MKSTTPSLRTAICALAAGAFLAGGAIVTAQTTQGHWNFDQGTPGEPFSPGEEGSASQDVPDQSGNGNWLSGWNEEFGPSFSAEGDQPFGGSGMSMQLNGGQDAWADNSNAAALNSWEPTEWTIETSVRLNRTTGQNQTLIGRDGTSFPDSEENPGGADFYLQTFDDGSTWRLDFSTLADERITIDSVDGGIVPGTGSWTGIAATSDGTTVSLYVTDESNEYQLVGTETFAVAGDPNNALASPDQAWTFGRGWWNGGFVDNVDGNMDNIRLTEGVLDSGDFMAVPEPSTYAAIFGALALAGAIYFRRRRNG